MIINISLHLKHHTSHICRLMAELAVQSSTFLFLEAFANLVTMHSLDQYDWLARTGSFSIYALLSQIVPDVRTPVACTVERNLQLITHLSCCRDFECLGIVSKEGSCGTECCVDKKIWLIDLNSLQQLGIREDFQQIPGNTRISKNSCTSAKCRTVSPAFFFFEVIAFESQFG